MKLKIKQNTASPFLLLLIVWGIINLIQARFTTLNNDEAYYWMYSKHLAWGYFDHPPMIALMIKAGYFFFKNELGVRLVTVLSQLLTVYIIWLLTDDRMRHTKGSVIPFFIIGALMPVFNIYGFISTPDVPLILFTAIFLLVYKRFLNSESWANTIFLALAIAGMMYSKYHSGLLIILVILSNPRLLLKIRFYIASFIALLLFMPHLIWQYLNDFPSFRYHLIDRVSGFNPQHAPEYLLNQFLFQNPFVLVIFIWIVIKIKPADLFDRALRFIVAGFFAFFFVSSFRYRVEPQWLAVVCVPIAIILFNNLDFRPWLKRYYITLAFVIFPLFIVARIATMIDFLPVRFFKDEFHRKVQWSRDISRIAGDKPVVFTNSFQRPAVYTFYTGKEAFTLDGLWYRRTQYDIWKCEEKLQGKDVLYVPHYYSGDYKANLTGYKLTDGDSVFVKEMKNFRSLQRDCAIFPEEKYSFKTGMQQTINLKLYNPYPYPIVFDDEHYPIVMKIGFFMKGHLEYNSNIEFEPKLKQLNTGETIDLKASFETNDLPPGIYKMAVCSETGIFYEALNSKTSEADVSGQN